MPCQQVPVGSHSCGTRNGARPATSSPVGAAFLMPRICEATSSEASSPIE